MQEQIPFEIPGPSLPTTTLPETDFFEWSKGVEDRNDVNIEQYLKARGFEIGKHTLTQDQYGFLLSMKEIWHNFMPHIREPRKLRNLLIPATEESQKMKGQGLLLWNNGKRYYPTLELLAAVQKAGWIYRVEPATTYLEVINGYLFLKYQSIIGSRRMAKLSDWKEKKKK